MKFIKMKDHNGQPMILPVDRIMQVTSAEGISGLMPTTKSIITVYLQDNKKEHLFSVEIVDDIYKLLYPMQVVWNPK